jgi:hypothetical protein
MENEGLTPAPTPQPPPTRHGRRLALAAAITAILAIPVGWLSYAYFAHSGVAAQTEEQLALSIVGGWWNIVGDRYLALDWEGRRATLVDFTRVDTGEESSGSWRASQNGVIVQVRGAGGELTQEFEVIGNDAELFLAPTPSGNARLLESWIADHDEETDDVTPGDSTSREARHRAGTSRLVGWSHSRHGMMRRHDLRAHGNSHRTEPVL